MDDFISLLSGLASNLNSAHSSRAELSLSLFDATEFPSADIDVDHKAIRTREGDSVAVWPVQAEEPEMGCIDSKTDPVT